jgi:hypothetical protein
MPIKMATGVTLRTVTFWCPANYLGITDWPCILAQLFDEDLRPDRRLLALPEADREVRWLASPGVGRPVRCAGGPLRLIDVAGTGALAAEEAAARHRLWSATGHVVPRRRPRSVELALLRAGRDSYVTYHRLRRVVGDALLARGCGDVLVPADARPQTLLDHLRTATSRLADADPDDVLYTVAA